MDAFRGMKLIRKDGDKNYAINIKVDFDTSKHLSDSNIKRRRIIRDRLISKENAKKEEERKELQALEARKEKERFGVLFIYIFFIWGYTLFLGFILKYGILGPKICSSLYGRRCVKMVFWVALNQQIVPSDISNLL